MIVGTAGHIDHGKTLLVKALTGVDTDRLKEEKARGITIELGFAYAPLPDGSTLGFVDVPGHERFVHTMLAGAVGIDTVLLVVAADDGVMPQTREHVQILDLLGLSRGLVALTKADLVDAERIAAVSADIRTLLQDTGLAGAEILPVSAVTGAGIDSLKARLADATSERRERRGGGLLRMAIDRSFTLAGTGTVVTGTLLAGQIAVGDQVTVLPQGLSARVRGLRAQSADVPSAMAGVRCAVNLSGSGVTTQAIRRGDWLVATGQTLVAERFDARLQLLATEARSVRQWCPVHLHVGTTSLPARIVLLDGDMLAPGDDAFVQIVASAPVPVRHGDRFVVRDAGAERTMGGGRVLDPRAPARRRRTKQRLGTLAALDTEDVAAALVDLASIPPGLVDLDALAADWNVDVAQVDTVATELELVRIAASSGHHATLPETWQGLAERVVAALRQFHAEQPAQPGMTLEKLRLALEPRLTKPHMALVADGLAAEGKIVLQSTWARLPDHASSLANADAAIWNRVKPLLEASSARPPTVREMAEHIGQPVARVRAVCKTMARIGELSEIATDRFFFPSVVLDMARRAKALAEADPEHQFTAAQFKDSAGCGRNVGIQVLEYFDRRGLTLRKGDARRVVKDPEALFGTDRR
jgi:selenocysteine-specific elongation factor